jgi:hypothetical protein
MAGVDAQRSADNVWVEIRAEDAKRRLGASTGRPFIVVAVQIHDRMVASREPEGA